MHFFLQVIQAVEAEGFEQGEGERQGHVMNVQVVDDLPDDGGIHAVSTESWCNDIAEDVLIEEEDDVAEETDMDNMFDETNYPTLTEIENAKEPEIGMCFASKDEAYHFFKVYARKIGFAIRKDSTYKSRVTGLLQRQVFVCNRQGRGVLNDDPGRKRRSNIVMRTECKVSMRVKLDSNQWKIIGVNLEHNHELAPSKWLVRFMKCHKSMTPTEKKFIEILQNSRVPPRKVMSIFRMLRTHLRAVGFDARDVTNLKSQENKKHRNKDVDELLTLFKDR